MSRDKNYLQTKSPKLVFSFRSVALAVVALSACAAVQGCYWDDSIVKEFIGDQGYLVTCRGRCIHEDIVAKEDCKGDYYVWVEEVKDDKGDKGDNSNGDTAAGGNDGNAGTEGGNASSAPEGSKKAGRCLIQGKAQCEAVAKLPAYAGKDIHWLDLDFQMLDLGGGQYVRFIAKEDYDPQNESSVRKNMEGDYVCGTYDEVTSGLLDESKGEDGKKTYTFNRAKVLEHTCTKERIDKMNASFQGRSCPVVSNKCGYVDLLRNDNNAFVDEPIGFCSKCDVQQVMCGAKCVDLRNNAQHCGSCNRVCGLTEFCNNGECKEKSDCKDGYACLKDDGSVECVKPYENGTCGAMSCDERGVDCGSAKKCEMNAENAYVCVSFCSKGQEPCEIVENNEKRYICLNAASDTTCGINECPKTAEDWSAVRACSDDKSCIKNADGNYSCQCEEGEIIDNNGKCYLPSSIYSCGNDRIDCTKIASNSEEQSRYVCANVGGSEEYSCQCKEKYISVGTGSELRCIDTTQSNEYCGATKDNVQSCTNGKQCVDGKCVCINGVECNGVCRDPESNNLHCGAKGSCDSPLESNPNYAGKECGVRERCVEGKCVCIEGYISRNGECISPDDIKTCGATETSDGINCPEIGAAICANRECVCPTNSAQTQWEIVKVDGIERCVDILSDPDHCGLENIEEMLIKCSDSELCMGGRCQSIADVKCPEGMVRCGRSCLDTTTYHISRENEVCKCDEGYCQTKTDTFEYGCKNVRNSDQFCGGCREEEVSNDCTSGEFKEQGLTSCVKNEEGNYICGCPGDELYCDFLLRQDEKGYNCIDVSHLNIERVEDEKSNERKVVGKCIDMRSSNTDAVDVVCKSTYGNCDGNMENGCEQKLATNDHCGGCGIVCGDTERAYGDCSSGVCKAELCKEDFKTCPNDNSEEPCGTRINNIERNQFNENTSCGGCGKGKKRNTCKDRQSCRNFNCCYDNNVVSSSKIKNGQCCDPEASYYSKCQSQFVICWNYDYQCAKSSPGDDWKIYKP